MPYDLHDIYLYEDYVHELNSLYNEFMSSELNGYFAITQRFVVLCRPSCARAFTARGLNVYR